MWSAILSIFIRYVLPVLVVLGLIWYGLNWVYTKGSDAKEAQLRPGITKLEKDVETANNAVAAAVLTAKGQAAAHATALQVQHDAYVQLLARMQVRLDKSETNAKKLKEQIDAKTPTLVTPVADAACVVPRGFVRLHNLAAAFDPNVSPEGPDLSPGQQGDVDAPSGFALSVVGKTVAKNYVTCQQDREKLRLWQDWYHGAYEAWEAAVHEQSNFRIVMPLDAARPTAP